MRKGEIVAFLDGDDWWERHKLRAIVEAFDRNPQAGVVGHGIIQIDSDTGNGSALSPQQTGCFDLRSDEGAQKFRNYMCFLGTSRVAIRRRILEKVLPIPEALLVEADEFMSAVAIAHGGAYLLAEPLTYYRLHDQNQYQFREGDDRRQHRKMNSLASLEDALKQRLAAAGVSPSATQIIVEPIHIATARMRLALDGGMPWETYRVERADFRLAYRETSLGYRAWKEAVLAVTLFASAALVLSPARLVLGAKSAAVPRRGRRACPCEPDRLHSCRLNPHSLDPGRARQSFHTPMNANREAH